VLPAGDCAASPAISATSWAGLAAAAASLDCRHRGMRQSRGPRDSWDTRAGAAAMVVEGPAAAGGSRRAGDSAASAGPGSRASCAAASPASSAGASLVFCWRRLGREVGACGWQEVNRAGQDGRLTVGKLQRLAPRGSKHCVVE
jgi:hypothetical protein